LFINHSEAMISVKIFYNLQKNSEGKINFCGVKADLSLNGLKQILYEPEERICIQENNPEPQKNIHTLDKIRIHKTIFNYNAL